VAQACIRLVRQSQGSLLPGHRDGGAERRRAIELALAAQTTPLRLQLGADAVATVRAHADQLLGDLAAWEKVAVDTRIEPVVASQS
jgi:hypothetical protein